VCAQLGGLDNRLAVVEQELSAASATHQEHLETRLKEVDAKIAAAQAGAASPALHTALKQLEARVEEVDAVLRHELGQLDETLSVKAEEEVQRGIDVARANLQMQVDQLSTKVEKREVEHEAKQVSLHVLLHASLCVGSQVANVTRVQEEKLKEVEAKLTKAINDVANSPVQLNLTPDVKKSLLKDFDKQFVALKAEILHAVGK